MNRLARAAALRSTALATSLTLTIGFSALAGDAWASKVPLPKPRPIARNVVPKTAASTATASAATAGKPTSIKATSTAAATATVATAVAKDTVTVPAPAVAPLAPARQRAAA